MFRRDGQHGPGPAATVVAWAALLGVLASIAVATVPFVRLAYRAPGLHVAVETANGLVAALLGYLLYGRFRETRRTQLLLLLLGLSVVAVANLVLTALPSALVMGPAESSRWAGVTVRLIGTLMLGAAALTPQEDRIEPRRARTAVLTTVVVVLAAGGLTWGWTGPGAIVSDLSRPSIAAHPVLLIANLVSVLVYSVAAWRFTRQAAGVEDHLLRWLGAGCLLGAFAGLHYAFFPSLYSDYLYSGDVLRLGFYTCMLLGAAKEIRSYFELRTRMAVLAARRRVARDLHDGLAQELSYLWSQSQALVAAGHDGGDDERIERITGAAGRALDEARRAIASLTRPLDEPFPRVLQQTADDLGARYGVTVATDLDPAATLELDRGEALLRISAEAIRNAVQHGAASRVDVVLAAVPMSLTVRDDGDGFSPGRAGAVRGGGFGLTSMRERAEGMGGRLEVTSAPGEGTTVRVTWT